jgi:glycosyltransferase involved in cell wall biosynthesis
MLAGFVRDLKRVYERSRCVVCPVFGTTGPQVKIVEAMAYGVPVVALRAAAAGSPIRHGVNGYIATTADEFADYLVELWNHQGLCRQMGQAARETIASEYSRSSLVHRLSSIFHAR